MRSTRTALFTILALLTLAPAAFAGTDTDNLEVTASVQNSCVITGGTLAFGVYDTVTGAQLDASTSISVECTTGATATIMLGQGANADTGSTDDAPLRRLNDGGTNYLSYQLYSAANRGTVWGNTAGTGVEYTAASADAFAETVYGRIAGGQDVPAGSYSDTVIATVSF